MSYNAAMSAPPRRIPPSGLFSCASASSVHLQRGQRALDAQPGGRVEAVEDGPKARGLTHVHPKDVPLRDALTAVADPVRRAILRELAEPPDWTKACGTFDLPVTKATRSHHFAVLRAAGLIEQRDEGPRRLNRLRRPEFDEAFPGLLGSG